MTKEKVTTARLQPQPVPLLVASAVFLLSIMRATQHLRTFCSHYLVAVGLSAPPSPKCQQHVHPDTVEHNPTKWSFLLSFLWHGRTLEHDLWECNSYQSNRANMFYALQDAGCRCLSCMLSFWCEIGIPCITMLPHGDVLRHHTVKLFLFFFTCVALFYFLEFIPFSSSTYFPCQQRHASYQNQTPCRHLYIVYIFLLTLYGNCTLASLDLASPYQSWTLIVIAMHRQCSFQYLMAHITFVIMLFQFSLPLYFQCFTCTFQLINASGMLQLSIFDTRWCRVLSPRSPMSINF